MRKPGATQEQHAPLWIKCFVLFHLLAITVWALPNPPQGIVDGKVEPAGTDWILVYDKKYVQPAPPFQQYLILTGFWQYWDMFAPDPVQQDVWCDAEVLYKDGSKRRYGYPRIYDLPILAKYPKERYRKFFERAPDPTSAFLWAQFGQRIAYLNADNPANPPVKVFLHKHVLLISPPGLPQATQYTDQQYYVHVVDQRRLAKDLARG